MENDHPYIAVNTIILKEGKILLMQRSKTDLHYAEHWGLVGGFMEWEETGEQTAIREAKEEIGVSLKIEHFIGRPIFTAHPSRGIVTTLCYYASIQSGIPHPAQPEECMDVKWFTPSEIRHLNLAFDHQQILIDEKLI